MGVETASQGDVQQASGEPATACLPSRLSRVRVPSPAPTCTSSLCRPARSRLATTGQRLGKQGGDVFMRKKACSDILPLFLHCSTKNLTRCSLSQAIAARKPQKNWPLFLEIIYRRAPTCRVRCFVRQAIVGCLTRNVAPTALDKGGFSEISIELSIKAGIGSADGTPLSGGIPGTKNRSARSIRCPHRLCAQIRHSAAQSSRGAETTKPAGTSPPLRARSPTSPSPGMESRQSNLCQTADPFPAHPEVAELDINPLHATSAGLYALDALVILES